MNAAPMALKTGSRLLESGLTLSTAESCTGGLVSKLLTDIPGSSAYYMGGIISYSNESKIKLLGVRKDTLKDFGAVSSETALEMADGVRKALSTDLSLAVTGIAGPGGGSDEKPVGTVFIACAKEGRDTLSMGFHFKGTRAEIRAQSAEAALELLLKRL